MLEATLIWIIGAIIHILFLIVFLRRRRVTAFAAFLMIGITVYLRPIMFIFNLDRPFPYEWFDSKPWLMMADAILVSAVWSLVMGATYLLTYNFVPNRYVLPKAGYVHPSRVVWIGFFLTLINLFCTMWLVKQQGGVASFVFAVKISKDLAGAYLFREIGTLAVVFLMWPLLAVGRAMEEKTISLRSYRKSICCIIILILSNFFVNYLWGNRYNIAVLLLAIFAAWHLHVRKIRFSRLIVFGIVVIFLMNALKTLRTYFISSVVGRDVSANFPFWTELSSSLHMIEFDALMLALRDVGERFPYRDGADIVNGLLSWVPRSLYPEKETFHTGKWFAQMYDPSRRNGWPVTTQGDWFMQYGWFGILMGGIVSGLAIATFDSHYRDLRKNSASAALVSGFAFSIFYSGVSFAFPQRVVLLLIPVWICIQIATFRPNIVALQYPKKMVS